MMSVAVRAFTAVVFAMASAVAFAQAQPMVRLHTTQGPIDMQLVPDAPITTANFLAYVRAGDYANTLVHRNAWVGLEKFIIQGGGYVWPPGQPMRAITARPPIQNEFSASRSNVRGTVAMAKIANNPNSATSHWFINMRDNAANLDAQNGGYTVFARVTTPSMVVADAIAALQRLPGTEIPIAGDVTSHQLVIVREAQELAAPASDSDRIFNYLEAAFPQVTKPWKSDTREASGYVFRYYSESNTLVGTKDGLVWYAIGSAEPQQLGTVAEWLAVAQGAGY